MNPMMGVVSLLSQPPLPFFSFLMMIFGATLFFSSPPAASPLPLSSCLARSALPQPFHTSVPQLVRVLPAPAVNYSSPTRVLTAQKCASFDRRGPFLFFLRVFFVSLRRRRALVGPAPQPRIHPPPHYRRNCSGISSPLERLSRWSSAARNECHVGRGCAPTTAENLRWRLDAWSPPPAVPPGCQSDHAFQVLDSVRFRAPAPPPGPAL